MRNLRGGKREKKTIFFLSLCVAVSSLEEFITELRYLKNEALDIAVYEGLVLLLVLICTIAYNRIYVPD